MKRVFLEESWPDSWKRSYAYDREEIYGEIHNRGYAYAYDNRRRQTLRLLTEVLAPGARILDLAGAQGNFSLALAEMGYRVTWNDLRAELAEYVRLKHERGEMEYAPGNAFELNLPADFDAVLITEVIEHVAHPDDFLRKTAQLVRPGGFVVMTTPNGAYFKNNLPKFSECSNPAIYESEQFKPDADGHIFLLHPDEIEKLAGAAGLEIDEQVLFTNPLTSGHVKTSALLALLPRALLNGIEMITQYLPKALQEPLMIQLGVRFRKPNFKSA